MFGQPSKLMGTATCNVSFVILSDMFGQPSKLMGTATLIR